MRRDVTTSRGKQKANRRWRRRVERQGHAERMSGGGSTMIGDATTSQNAERQRHVNRMNCKGGATRDNATIIILNLRN
jgi:hypothetical protein